MRMRSLVAPAIRARPVRGGWIIVERITERRLYRVGVALGYGRSLGETLFCTTRLHGRHAPGLYDSFPAALDAADRLAAALAAANEREEAR